MKRLAIAFLILVIGTFLFGCDVFMPEIPTLVLNAPESGYPPLEVTLVATDMGSGQYTFEVEGETYMQVDNELDVVIQELPCTITVTWIGNGDPQVATATIGLDNKGPVIGRPVFNFITNLWTLHAKEQYIVTFPYATDREGGPVRLTYARVQYVGWPDNTVFCPPFTGENPPIIDEYHVQLSTGQIVQNAFVFFQGWFGPVDAITTSLPYSPPDWAVNGYPGGGTCGLTWPRETRPGTDVIITATFEDEQGAPTTDSWTIPANPYIGCGDTQTSSSVL